MRRIKQHKAKGFAIFMDFSKAFDKVNHTKMLVKVKYKWSQRVWLSLVRYYQNATLFVYDKNEGYSDSFNPCTTMINLVQKLRWAPKMALEIYLKMDI
jgi:hypothetical protein